MKPILCIICAWFKEDMELEQRVLSLKEHMKTLYQNIKSVQKHIKSLEHQPNTFAENTQEILGCLKVSDHVSSDIALADMVRSNYLAQVQTPDTFPTILQALKTHLFCQ
jgi:hypothetical protein